jgi:amidase
MLRIGRDEHVWSFDANREPVVTVEPGTVLEIETWDCFTGQVQSESDTLEKIDLNRVNSATGPIAVRGAEPGDTLSVTLLDIRPGEKGAAMCIPGWGQLIGEVHSPTTRIFTVADGVVTMNERVSFPARPMFGVIGVSPASGDITTFLADRHGGNMDDHVNGSVRRSTCRSSSPEVNWRSATCTRRWVTARSRALASRSGVSG